MLRNHGDPFRPLPGSARGTPSQMAFYFMAYKWGARSQVLTKWGPILQVENEGNEGIHHHGMYRFDLPSKPIKCRQVLLEKFFSFLFPLAAFLFVKFSGWH